MIFGVVDLGLESFQPENPVLFIGVTSYVLGFCTEEGLLEDFKPLGNE